MQEELAQCGVRMNIKEVHAIGRHAGQAALAHRLRTLELYRQGKLPAGDGRGKRLAVMIDGGRTKLRRDDAGRRARASRRRRSVVIGAEWREPKLIIMFEMDEQGRMQERDQADH